MIFFGRVNIMINSIRATYGTLYLSPGCCAESGEVCLTCDEARSAKEPQDQTIKEVKSPFDYSRLYISWFGNQLNAIEDFCEF